MEREEKQKEIKEQKRYRLSGGEKGDLAENTESPGVQTSTRDNINKADPEKETRVGVKAETPPEQTRTAGARNGTEDIDDINDDDDHDIMMISKTLSYSSGY